MEIWAHRCHGYDKLLENMLPAFQRAIDDGVDGIELDVHISVDGVPFVFHDDCLRRLSVGVGEHRSQRSRCPILGPLSCRG